MEWNNDRASTGKALANEVFHLQWGKRNKMFARAGGRTQNRKRELTVVFVEIH